MLAQPPGSPGNTHGSSWHQKWLTAKAIATRTRKTATAIRPCIQGCRVPRPGKRGERGCFSRLSHSGGCKYRTGEGAPHTPRTGACVTGHRPAARTRGEILGGRGEMEDPSDPLLNLRKVWWFGGRKAGVQRGIRSRVGNGHRGAVSEI